MSDAPTEVPPEGSTGDLLADPSDLATRSGLAVNDPRLIDALKRLSARFRGETNNHVTLVEDDVYHASGRGRSDLPLPQAPIVGDVEVRIGGKLVPASDYQVGRRAGVLRHNHRWPDGLENIEVTYSHGHATVPPDIQDAVLEMAEAFLNFSAGVELVETGDERVKIANSLINGGATGAWSAAVAKYTLGGNTDRV